MLNRRAFQSNTVSTLSFRELEFVRLVAATANLVHSTNQRLVELVSKPEQLSGHQYVHPSGIRVVPGSRACYYLNTLYGVKLVRKPQNITHFASTLPTGPTLTEHTSVGMRVTGEPARSPV